MYKYPCIKNTDSGSYELHCEYHRYGRQQELCATTALRPHAKLNPRTPLTPAFLAHKPNLRGAVP